MSYRRKRVVLVSAPGLVQKATESTLTSCPGVELVATVPGALSATTMLSKIQPDILLIDATLAEEEIRVLLDWVKGNLPDVYCAALTITTRQRDHVLTWGADAAVHRSSLPDQLKVILEGKPG